MYRLRQLDSVFTSIPAMEAALGPSLTTSQKQKLLRLIFRELLNNKHRSVSGRFAVVSRRPDEEPGSDYGSRCSI